MTSTGDIEEIRGEIEIKWEIKNFFPISDKIYNYISPQFYFAGTSWKIEIHPNGEPRYESEGWLSLYIFRRSTGYSVSADFTICITSLDDKTYIDKSDSKVFEGKVSGWGWKKVISKSSLMEMKSQFSASDDIVVICSMKSCKPQSVSRSYFHRLKGISDNLKEIYEKGKRSDFKLNFKGNKISAHRLILETRSPVFAAMLCHDSKENLSGEVCIDDIESETMNAILEYMYTCDMKDLTLQTVFPIYTAADKYDIKDIKDICKDFIIRNLSTNWVCDVIKFADLHQEEEISLIAREYFKKNAGKIMETEEWTTFAKENQSITVELLANIVKNLLQK